MKIALVVPGGVDPSGEYRVIPALLALIKRLARHHEVHVFALRQQPSPANWELGGAKIHNAGTRWTALRTLLSIRSEHRRSAFDLIQAIWSAKPGFLAALSAKFLGLPYLVHVAGGELVCLSDIGYGGSCSVAGRIRETLVLRRANAVTAASAAMVSLANEKGIATERIPLGVDLDIWSPLDPRSRNPEDPLRLIHIGSMNAVKDQLTLLKALVLVRDRGLTFSLDLVGDDVLGGRIQALSRAFDLSRCIRFHGFMSQPQLRSLMQTMHILVMSSRHEAGPVACLEAAATGVPTVGTDVGHIAEWQPAAAVAAPIGDPTRLADGICELASSEEQRLSIARNAMKRAVSESADYTATRFIGLYERVLAQS